MLGVKVDNQTIFEPADGRQGEHLRIHALLEIDDHAHGGRRVLSGTHAADIGVGGLDFARNALQHAVDAGAADVHHQTAGIVQREMLVTQGAGRFDGDTGIGLRRPDTHGSKLRRRRCFGERGGNRGQDK